jgi:glutamate--cysteine ligase
MPGMVRGAAMPPRLDRAALIASFQGYGSKKQLVGGEFERAVVRPDGHPIPYDGEHGIRWYLEEFARRWGWSTVTEDDHPIALVKDGANLTLEPGGQIELSGAPHAGLRELEQELAENRAQLLQLANEAGHVVIACGLTPIASIPSIPWMPKGRYVVMREYLAKRGELAHFMMKGTTSVQANFDYVDEADCAEKVAVAAGLAPLVTAIFASSPLYENKPTGFESMRANVWRHTDPDRTGFPTPIADGFRFDRWVDYLLEVPMMFYKRRSAEHPKGEWAHADGRTFREYMETGIEGQLAEQADWELHQTSVFPEVRIKRTIEVRCADGAGPGLALAFCALFAAILYVEPARAAASELALDLRRRATLSDQHLSAATGGLGGTIGGRPTGEWADALAAIVKSALSSFDRGSLPLVDPLLERIENRRSPARDLLDRWNENADPAAIVRAVAY